MDLALGMDNMNKDLENGGMEDRVVEVEYEDINRDLGNSETEDEVVEVEGEDQDLLGNIQGERGEFHSWSACEAHVPRAMVAIIIIMPCT